LLSKKSIPSIVVVRVRQLNCTVSHPLVDASRLFTRHCSGKAKSQPDWVGSARKLVAQIGAEEGT